MCGIVPKYNIGQKFALRKSKFYSKEYKQLTKSKLVFKEWQLL